MTVLASISLDLVEEILGHLHGDITTLKNCSTVSLTFYHPSRKLLFSCVVLDTPDSLVKLHTLLNELPEVTALVQTLHLRTFFPTDDTGAILLSVSQRLQHLRHLTLGCNKGLSWSRFSKSNVTALETLIGLGSLCSLEISHVYAIPLPFFNIARGIRRLKMELVYIENVGSAKDAVHFGKLETLSLGSSVLFEKSVSVAAPELRQLSVRGPHPSSLESAIQFINSTSSEIVDFSWSDFHFDNILLENTLFRIPSGVRRLTFEISKYKAVVPVTWSSIINVLNDSPAALTVETLKIIIRHSSVIASSTGYTFRPIWLQDFDVLADKFRFPKLTRVEFIVEPMTYDETITKEIMFSILEGGLLKVREAGTPTVNLCIDSCWHVRGCEERKSIST